MKRDTQKTKPHNTPCVMWNRHSSSHHRTECRTMIVLPPHNVLGFGLQRLITSEWAKKIRQIAAFHPSNLYIRLFYAPLLKGISDPSIFHNFSGFSRLFWNNYKNTRGPWTAMPDLIQVKETGQINKKIYMQKYSKLVRF